MPDDDAGAVDGLRRRVDIAPVFERTGIGAGPGALIQDKKRHRGLGHQPREVAREIGGVLASVFERGIEAVPLSSKDGGARQIWKRTNRWGKQQCIEQFHLSVGSAGEAVFIEGLTELSKSVKLDHHGRDGFGLWTNQFLTWGGLVQGTDRLFCYNTCLNSSWL